MDVDTFEANYVPDYEDDEEAPKSRDGYQSRGGRGGRDNQRGGSRSGRGGNYRDDREGYSRGGRGGDNYRGDRENRGGRGKYQND